DAARASPAVAARARHRGCGARADPSGRGNRPGDLVPGGGPGGGPAGGVGAGTGLSRPSATAARVVETHAAASMEPGPGLPYRITPVASTSIAAAVRNGKR